MATKADQARAQAARENSEQKRAGAWVPAHKSLLLREGTSASPKGRALHARTKLQADAKALKPMAASARSRPNGGEATTENGVPGNGRGSDGPPGRRPSRKSTRGAVAAGEKSSSLTRRVKTAIATPEARALRGR